MINTNIDNPRTVLVQCLPENFAWIRKTYFKFTLQQVADATGLSKRYISRAEKGKCDRFSVLQKIRDYYLGQYAWKTKFPETNSVMSGYELC